ncbi:MAG: ABC transporter permease [Desulfomonilaceae bacterium]
MTLEDRIDVSLRMVRRNWVRYKTVFIAIAIGTVGFIIVRTLGDAVDKRVTGNLELIGEVTILSAQFEDRRDKWHHGEYYLRDAGRLRKLPHVVDVAPIRNTDRILKAWQGNNKAEGVQVTCVDPHYWNTISPYLETGRLIDATDMARYAKVCVISGQMVKELFGGVNPIGKQLMVAGYPYSVVGTLGGPDNPEIARSIFVPLSLAMHHLGQIRQFTRFNIRVDVPENASAVRKQAEEVLRRAHPEFADSIFVRCYDSRLDRVNFVRLVVKIFIYLALIVIFILGKIGLTNVMLGAIQERRREIGLRKALGATDEEIRFQFVLESLIVSVGSGLVGAVVGLTMVLILHAGLGIEISASILMGSIFMDLIFTITIGVAAGFYPSREASRMDVVNAMRVD